MPKTQLPTKSAGTLTLPVLGLGTIVIGNRSRPGCLASDAEDIAFIQGAIERGITHIDTAVKYGDRPGRSEELIGEAIRGYDRRDELIIATKVPQAMLGYHNLVRTVDESTRRLGSPPNLVYIHEANLAVPLDETLRALNFLLASGRIGAVGLSKFTGELLRQAIGFRPWPVSCNQFRLNLGSREFIQDLTVQLCRQMNMLVVAYRPLFKGQLVVEARTQLEAIADTYGVTAEQLAIAWVVRQHGVVAIAGMTKLEHVEQNLAAATLEISDEEAATLEATIPHMIEKG